MSPLTQTVGHHYYVRDDILDFGSILSGLKQETQYVHLYCDTLNWDTSLPNASGIAAFKAPWLRSVHIYARDLFPKVKATTSIYFNVKNINNGSNAFRLSIFFDTCPEGLQIGHVIQPGLQPDFAIPISRAPGSTCAGIFVARPIEPATPATASEKLLWNREIPQVPEEELTHVVPGSAAQPISMNLSDLLFPMFILASDNITSNQEAKQKVAISSLRYLSLCTRTSTSQAALFNNVQRVLAPLELPSKSLAQAPFSSVTQRFEVPVLITERYLSVLKDLGNQLFLLEQFEKVVSEVADSNRALQEQQTSDVKKVLDSLALTATSFVNNAANLSDASDAMTAAVKMQEEMTEKQKAVDAAFVALQSGLTKYNTKKNNAAKKLGVDAAIKASALGTKALLGSIKLDFGAWVDVAEFAKEQREKDLKAAAARKNYQAAMQFFSRTMPKLVTDVATVSAMFETLKPFMKGLKSGTLSAAETEDMFSKVSNAPPLDYFGLRNRWSEFPVELAKGFKAFRDALQDLSDTHGEKELQDIEGLANYEAELTKLAIRGQTALDAQLKANDALSVYSRGLAETSARTEVQNSIKESAKNAAQVKKLDDDKNKRLELQALTREEVASSKMLLFTHYFQALLSYTYRAGLAAWPNDATLKVNSGSSSFAFISVATKMDSSLLRDAKFKDQAPALKPIVITTDLTKGAFPDDWRGYLIRDRAVPFQILPTHEALRNYWHHRIDSHQVRFTISGSGAEVETVYDLEIGPHFLDRLDDGSLAHFVIDPFREHRLGSIGAQRDKDKASNLTPPACFTGRILFGKREEDLQRLVHIQKITLSVSFSGISNSKWNDP